MKKKLCIYMVVIAAMITVSCEGLENITDKLTESEVIEGLKEALSVGSESASRILGVEDGYYGDALVKILLPPEVGVIKESIEDLPVGGDIIDGLLEDLVLSINRSAEDAAKEVAPVFKGAITSMTINDGLSILKGDSTAATQYLKTNTYSELLSLYGEKINSSLKEPFIGNRSTNEIWTTLTDQWNTYAPFLGKEPVNTNLGGYLTGKALDGLFLKLADEEVKIRTDPAARVTDILRRVFGSEEAQQ